MMKKRTRVILSVIGVLALAAIVTDYVVYRQDLSWWSKLQTDIPVGTPLSRLRPYLEGEGEEHGIQNLKEFDNAQGHWFVFFNHNRSLLFRPMAEGFDYLFQSGVNVTLDDDERVKEIHTFKY